jgi:motility quorum-sensing regulator/GCU-specific mRNA interferase toxin
MRITKSGKTCYYAPCPNGKIAYIKFTMQEGAVVIQFKEK